MRRTFLISILLSTTLFMNFSSKSCPKITQHILIEEEDKDAYSLVFEVEGGEQPYIIQLMANNEIGHLKSIKLDTLKGLMKGEYILIVQDQTGCHDTKIFEIK